jgi:hypothetical protein
MLEGSEGVENIDLNISECDSKHGMTFEYDGSEYGAAVKFESNVNNWIKVFPLDEIRESERDRDDLMLSREGDSDFRYFGENAGQLANEAYRLVTNNADDSYSFDI